MGVDVAWACKASDGWVGVLFFGVGYWDKALELLLSWRKTLLSKNGLAEGFAESCSVAPISHHPKRLREASPSLDVVAVLGPSKEC